MRKITRSSLKEIVKECLVEILSEGLDGTSRSLDESTVNRVPGKFTKTSTSRSQANRRPALDHVAFSNGADSNQTRAENTALDRKIKNTVQSMTSDNVLSSILEDTARTTLQEQARGESSRALPQGTRHADSAARESMKSDPSELFGNASSKWADLAFAPPINKT
jgi:hypothetical protein